MIAGQVRPQAICLFRKGNSILVAEGHDPVKGETFYRPLGGAIEFGETSQEAIVREVREEIHAELKNLHYLGVVENIFTYKGEKGHEVVLVYGGEFVDKSFYTINPIDGAEDDGTPFKAVWKPLNNFQKGHTPLYPDGLLELIR